MRDTNDNQPSRKQTDADMNEHSTDEYDEDSDLEQSDVDDEEDVEIHETNFTENTNNNEHQRKQKKRRVYNTFRREHIQTRGSFGGDNGYMTHHPGVQYNALYYPNLYGYNPVTFVPDEHSSIKQSILCAPFVLYTVL